MLCFHVSITKPNILMMMILRTDTKVSDYWLETTMEIIIVTDDLRRYDIISLYVTRYYIISHHIDAVAYHFLRKFTTNGRQLNFFLQYCTILSPTVYVLFLVLTVYYLVCSAVNMSLFLLFKVISLTILYFTVVYKCTLIHLIRIFRLILHTITNFFFGKLTKL